MKTKLLTIGTKYKITPLNWSFQSSGLAKYEILDENDNVLMKYSNTPFSLGRILHIAYKEKKMRIWQSLFHYQYMPIIL